MDNDSFYKASTDDEIKIEELTAALRRSRRFNLFLIIVNGVLVGLIIARIL
jgi:hypothetical protein